MRRSASALHAVVQDLVWHAAEVLEGYREIEQVFQRMALVSLGRPMSHVGSVTNRHEAAALLHPRELMHHWGVAGIVLPAIAIAIAQAEHP
jgi:hypothetical protein